MKLSELADAWQTLKEIGRAYDLGSEPWDTLTEARRLLEVEMRATFGDTLALPLIERLHG